MLRNLGEAARDEARDATENRHYGPIMTFAVLLFWAAVVAMVASAVDCEPSAHETQMKKDGWR